MIETDACGILKLASHSYNSIRKLNSLVEKYDKFSRSWILIDDKICDPILYFEKKEIRGDILADFVATRFHRWNIMPKKFNSRNDAARRLLKWCHLLSETACTEQRGG